jgi:hypothetical protein
MRATSDSDWHTASRRIVLLIVLGALLVGCDKCGDWSFSSTLGESQSCRREAPPPQ